MNHGKFHYEKCIFPIQDSIQKKSLAYWMLLRNYVTSIVEPFYVIFFFCESRTIHFYMYSLSVIIHCLSARLDV